MTQWRWSYKSLAEWTSRRKSLCNQNNLPSIFNFGAPFCFQFSNAVILGQYGYDIRSLRRSAARAGGTNFFIYDSDGNLLAETDADGNILREYAYLDGQRLALFDLTNSDAVFYYLNDHLGTAQILLDNQGVVVWQGNCRPFGEVDVIVNNVANYFRFPGQIFDIESGLHYRYPHFCINIFWKCII